jgi:Ca2+-binding EF-hand superfamily protein
MVRETMMQRIDADGDYALSFDEFILLYEEVQRRVNCLRFARAKFFELDADESGFLGTCPI